MTVAEKLAKQGPRKLLTIDGGGIRGLIAVEVLAEVENLLRPASGRGKEFRLADYFDYIAGTSTGAIIATCLSLGMSVGEIREFYKNNGKAMFDRVSAMMFWKRFKYKYSDTRLQEQLKDVIGLHTPLGTDRLRTLLMLVLRNATTDSPWPISNNPCAKYNDRQRLDCNLDLPLWQLVRASTAAPTFFPPEKVVVGKKEFIFVDGGITMYNNPAFQLFLMATVEPYCLCWPTGEDKMLLVSVGTGTSPDANANLQPDELNLLYNATSIPAALMSAALNEQDFLCRVFGKCLCGDMLDRELGDMISAACGPVMPKLFTYVRYNAELSKTGLEDLGLPSIDPANVQMMDSVEHLDELRTVGSAVAARKVHPEHFAAFPC